MSDELDEVRRYVNAIRPPDEEAMAQVQRRLGASEATSGLDHAHVGPSSRVKGMRWVVAAFVVMALVAALITAVYRRVIEKYFA